MTNLRISIIGSIVCVAIYLFATAPAELPDSEQVLISDRQINSEQLFNTANSINNAARLVYTKKIVGPGLLAGLEFGEDWAEPGVDEGPLPALFLRLVAGRMETKPEPLGLYLGSDEPINTSNLFSGSQMEQFELVKTTLSPTFGESEDAYLVAMYPDIASAIPCVDCHNEHPDSPKTDWKLDDIMGATTWTYPKSIITESNLLDTSRAVFMAVEEAYQMYLDKTETYKDKVELGTTWPTKENRALPDLNTFMTEVRLVAGSEVMHELLASKHAGTENYDESDK